MGQARSPHDTAFKRQRVDGNAWTQQWAWRVAILSTVKTRPSIRWEEMGWSVGRSPGNDLEVSLHRYRPISLSLSLSVFCVVVSSTRFFIFVKRGSNDSSYSYPRAINSVGKWMVVGNSRVFFFFSFFVVGYWSRIPGGGVVKRYKLAVFSARYQWNSILLPCVFSIRTNSFSRSLIIINEFVSVDEQLSTRSYLAE